MDVESFCWPRRALRRLAPWLASVCLLAPLGVFAHKGSDAYLTLASGADGRVDVRISITLKDLDVVLPVDGNRDGQVTWGEVRAAAPAVGAYFDRGMQWTHGGPVSASSQSCAPAWTHGSLERRSDGTYWVASATLPCRTPALRLRYRLMEEADRSHRLLVSGDWRGQPLLATLGPGEELAFGSAQAQAVEQAPGATLWNHLQTGALHLLEGYDHLAFLLALVLPLHLPLRGLFRPAPVVPLLRTAKASDWTRMFTTITAFTAGHSVTLGLAAWGWLNVSSDWVEPAIVASIGVSALLNVYPVRWLRTEVLAGLFGLVHGMGFAGLLLDAQAPLSLLPWALLGFNLGIEAAQLLVLFAWVLISQPLLTAPWHERRVVHGLSWSLVAFSLYLLPKFVGWY